MPLKGYLHSGQKILIKDWTRDTSCFVEDKKMKKNENEVEDRVLSEYFKEKREEHSA